MATDHDGTFVGFLRKYISASPSHRRKHYHVLVGMRVLACLEELFEAGLLTPAEARRTMQGPVREEIGPQEWVIVAGDAVIDAAAQFVARYGGQIDDDASYARLWQQALALLND